MVARRAAFVAILMVVALARAEESVAPPELVVLFSCDTMRADRLSVYGYDKDTTPNLRAFAESAVVFENAFTPEPWTPSAHMSMLTGLYPKHHGLTANINAFDTIETLPEVLKRAGYVTAGHAGMKWWFLPSRGFGRGFDEYTVPEGARDVFETARLGLDFLRQHPGQKSFLFLHTYDLHSHMEGTLPYGTNDPKYSAFSNALGAPPAFTRDGVTLKSPTAFLGAHNHGGLKITSEENAYMQALYDDGLARVDAGLGAFIAGLKELGLYDKALIIITADHGEAFGEHDRYMHGDIYEANVRVPLIVRFPGGAHSGTRTKSMARLIDLFPTIVEMTHAETKTAIDGTSLLPQLNSQSLVSDKVFLKRGAWRGMRGPSLKLIEDRSTGGREFFDVGADPLELHDAMTQNAPEFNNFQDAVQSFFAPPDGGWHIALRAGAAPWRLDIRVGADTRLASVALENGFFEERNDEVSEVRDVRGTLSLKAGETDVLHVLPLDPAATVRLSLEGDCSAAVANGDSVSAPAITNALMLDPAHASAVQPVPSTEGGACSVAVWFVPVAAKASAAQPLSDAAQEELDSLGYLDSKTPKPAAKSVSK